MAEPIQSVSAVGGFSAYPAWDAETGGARLLQAKEAAGQLVDGSAEVIEYPIDDAIISALINAIAPIGMSLMAFQSGQLESARAQTDAKLKETQQEEE